MSELQSFFDRRRARRWIIQALRERAPHRRRRPAGALRQGPRVAAAGPRAPLPDLYEVVAPAEGNLLADTVVLAHGA